MASAASLRVLSCAHAFTA